MYSTFGNFRPKNSFLNKKRYQGMGGGSKIGDVSFDAIPKYFFVYWGNEAFFHGLHCRT